MQLQLTMLIVSAMIAGPAAAQGAFAPRYKPHSGFGSYGSSSASKPKSHLPDTSSPAARIYGAPKAPGASGFEPYKPFSGNSVYSRPKAATPGAKPCETSVYINACDRRR